MVRRDEVETALRTVLLLGMPDVEELVFERQRDANGPRPPQPYATLRVVRDDRRSGTHGDTLTDTADGSVFVRRLESWREGVVRVDVYGDGAADILRKLDVRLLDTDVQTAMDTAGVNVLGSLSILDGTELQSSTWQRRAQSDLRFRYRLRDETLRDQAIESLDLTLET